ncbi:MAG: chromosomal replication initiator protein DnaA, partial [Phyllobacteriaceae bacterium]|nr:chromosomal replication initiator protein DnaA [Phyllobacteriaceae bacterium]
MEARAVTRDPDVRDEWERIKARLRVELGEDVFTSWFARVECEQLSADTVHLSVPTRFLKNWLQSRYRDRLLVLFRETFTDVAQIEFAVRSAMRPAAGAAEAARRPTPVLVAANAAPRPAA